MSKPTNEGEAGQMRARSTAPNRPQRPQLKRDRTDTSGYIITSAGDGGRGRWGKVLAILLGVTLVVALAAAGSLWWVTNQLQGEVSTISLPDNALVATANALPQSFMEALTSADEVSGEPLNILVLGSDTREGQGGRFGSTEEITDARSDTSVLVHLAGDRQSATVLSIPRDLVVAIPECETPQGVRLSETRDRFNAAFTRGGTACTIATVTRLTGIPVNHVAVVDFKGFEAIIDRIGGIRVCLRESVDDTYARVTLPAGAQKVMGRDALGLMRARYSLGDGSDLSRIGRQQKLARIIVATVMQQNLLTDPAKLYGLLSDGAKNLSTDEKLSRLPALAGLAAQARNIPQENIMFKTVPIEYNSDGATVRVGPGAKTLFRQIANDTVPLVPTKGSPLVAPESTGKGEPKKGEAGCKNPL